MLIADMPAFTHANDAGLDALAREGATAREERRWSETSESGRQIFWADLRNLRISSTTYAPLEGLDHARVSC
jgi:hypothetical protein